MSALTTTARDLFGHPWPPLTYDMIALLVVALFAWRGYRRGVIRELATIVSIAGSAFLAGPLGSLLLPFLPLGGLPGFLHPVTAAAVGGVLVYPMLRITLFLFASFSGLLRAREGKAALAIQMGGACAGGVFGVGIMLILGWYTLSMGQIFGFLLRAAPPTEAATEKKDPLLLPATLAAVHRGGLRASGLGTAAAATNPVPEEAVEGVTVIMEALQEPENIGRLAAYPPVVKLMEQASVRELAANAEIRALAAKGDIMGIVNHAAFQKVTEDPALREFIREASFQEIVALLQGEAPTNGAP